MPSWLANGVAGDQGLEPRGCSDGGATCQLSVGMSSGAAAGLGRHGQPEAGVQVHGLALLRQGVEERVQHGV